MPRSAKESSKDLPIPSEKQSLLEFLEEYLPFKIPRIPLPQTAKNLDKAAAKLVLASSENILARIEANSKRIKTRSKAESDFIAAGSEAALQTIHEGNKELADRAINYALGDAMHKQANREKILEIAVGELDQSPPKEDSIREIDTDWLNIFSDFAEHKTDADIQSLWGKILAGEIRSPGSFSLRTLSSLSTLDTEEADFVYSYMKLVIDGSFIYGGKNYKNLSVANEIRLEELGVVAGIGGVFGRGAYFKKNKEVFYFNHNFAVKLIPKKDYEKSIQCILLSGFGKQLFTLCGQIEGNLEYMTSFGEGFIHENCDGYILHLDTANNEDPRKILSETPLEIQT